jgi:hypothetical protein
MADCKLYCPCTSQCVNTCPCDCPCNKICKCGRICWCLLKRADAHVHGNYLDTIVYDLSHAPKSEENSEALEKAIENRGVWFEWYGWDITQCYFPPPDDSEDVFNSGDDYDSDDDDEDDDDEDDDDDDDELNRLNRVEFRRLLELEAIESNRLDNLNDRNAELDELYKLDELYESDESDEPDEPDKIVRVFSFCPADILNACDDDDVELNRLKAENSELDEFYRLAINK